MFGFVTKMIIFLRCITFRFTMPVSWLLSAKLFRNWTANTNSTQMTQI
jgi:hypothetical protein